MNKYYKFYFEQLATKNKLIGHTGEARAFFYIQDQFDLDAFDHAIRDAVKTPALLLEDYSTSTSDGASSNYHKQFAGRFTIVDSAQIGDHESIGLAKERCEMIANQILKRMLKDFAAGQSITIAPGDASPKVFFHLASAKIEFVGPMATNYYGATVGFTLDTGFNAVSLSDDWIA